MDDIGAFCPNEECADNDSGICALRRAAMMGMASMAFMPLGNGTFASPISPVASMLPFDKNAGTDAEGSGRPGIWQDCPHKKGPMD